MPDGGGGRRADRRRQRRREDEAGRIGAHGIDQVGIRRDIAAEAAEGFCQRAFEDIDARGGAVAFGDSAAMRPVHADRVHLVDIGQRPVAFGEIADLVQRRDIAVHRVQAFAQDQFRPVRVGGAQQLLEMLDVVVAPHLLFGAGFAHALDHGIVVERVGEQQAIGQQFCDRGNAGLVGDIARGKDQRRFLAVQRRRVRARVRSGDDWCRRYCACPRPRCPSARRFRPSRPPPSDAGPCRGNRSSTRSPPRAAPPANARSHAGTGPPDVRDRRKPDSGARREAGSKPDRKRRCSP